MRNVKLLLTGLVAASAFALSPVSQAQTSGQWYAGLGFGQSKLKDACMGASDIGVSCDDTDTAMRIFGGFKFTKNLGLEVGYADLGKASGSGVVLGVPFSGEWKAKAWDIVAVGELPINDRFSVLGKIGVARWSVDATITATGIGSLTDSPTGAEPTYGVGAQYDFTNQIGLRAEWQKYKDIGDPNTTGESDVDVISASLLYKF